MDGAPEAARGLTSALGGVGFRLLARPVEKACRLLVVLAAAPVLGVGGFGAYQFAATATALLATTTELGLGTWTTRAIARDPSRAAGIVATGLRLRVLLAPAYLALVLLFAVGAAAAGASQDARLVVVFGFVALAGTLVDYVASALRGREDFRGEATLNGARAALQTGGALVGLFVGRTPLALATGLAAGGVASAAWGLSTLAPALRTDGLAPGAAGVKPEAVPAREVLRASVPLWLSGLLASLYFRGDVVLVRGLAGDAEVGAYAAAYRLFEATTLVSGAVMGATFPRLARARAAGGEPGVSPLERRVITWLLALGLALGAALAQVDARVVAALFGDGYAHAAPCLRVLAPAVPVLFASYALTDIVMARGLERPFVLVLAALLALNVGLNLALVPRLGGVGAAWATLATEGAMAAGCALVLALAKPRAASGVV